MKRRNPISGKTQCHVKAATPPLGALADTQAQQGDLVTSIAKPKPTSMPTERPTVPPGGPWSTRKPCEAFCESLRKRECRKSSPRRPPPAGPRATSEPAEGPSDRNPSTGPRDALAAAERVRCGGDLDCEPAVDHSGYCTILAVGARCRPAPRSGKFILPATYINISADACVGTSSLYRTMKGVTLRSWYTLVKCIILCTVIV